MTKHLSNFICLLFFSFLFFQCRPSKQIENEWTLGGFVKVDSANPILVPDTNQRFDCPVTAKSIRWEEKNVLNPTALIKDNKIYLLYRAQDSAGTSRLGMAISDDGIHFKKNPSPILYPDNDSLLKYEWKGGIEDPRIVSTEDERYLLTYTSYDGKTARLCYAFSKDLLHWEKMGPVLKDEKYINAWSKSGAVVSKEINGKIVATKVDGKYWMYFGDTDIFLAYSEDLIHWSVAENAENKKMISVLHPRMGYHDSRLVEPGPFALITKDGILLLYNGSNAANFNDTSLPKYTYSAGQALFSASAPYQLIKRTTSYFIKPDKDYEKIGEVNEVCFIEGLVHFKNHWFLYYGTADSKIAVANN
ncbi:MAG: glycosidase [Chitinophagia bacterium]|nr:glycosidase [Chitinophagia bacterium]